MSKYLIGIGGSGAKCVESVAHLCASGLMPGENLYCLFVDADHANGTLQRAEEALQSYVACQSPVWEEKALFGTRVSIAKPDKWSPFEGAVNPKLKSFFHHTTETSSRREVAHAMEVLYTDVELRTELDQGFRGHPSIGAAIFSETVRLSDTNPWREFRQRLTQDAASSSTPRVMLVGSLFGGTGAAGLPTISRLVRQELLRTFDEDSFVLGAMLLLPYFSFKPPASSSELFADSKDFSYATKVALEYYHSQEFNTEIDAIYLLGFEDPSSSLVSTSKIGGKGQRNEPHFVDMFSGLGALDFFTKPSPKGIFAVAREKVDSLSWIDIPPCNSLVTVTYLERMARFAFFYLSMCYPMLEEIQARGRVHRAPWYLDYFMRRNLDLSSELRQSLHNVKTYCEAFLLWSAYIQATSEQLHGALFNAAAFCSFDEWKDKRLLKLKDPGLFDRDKFDNLILPESNVRRGGIGRVWHELSTAPESKRSEPVDAFIGSVFRAVA